MSADSRVLPTMWSPVAVVMSHREYERLRSRRPHFRDAYEDFLTRFSLDQVGLNDEWFETLRDRSPGRRVPL